MGRFSDSPYFLLRSFFDGLDNTKPIERDVLDYKWLVSFVSSFDLGVGSREYLDDKFTFETDADRDDVVFTDYNTTSWNRREHYDPMLVKTFNSYIIAPFINIAAKGGGIMDLFVKEEDKGYQPISVRYDHKDGNEFHFVNPKIYEYSSGPELPDDAITEVPMYLDGDGELLPVDEDKPGNKFLFRFFDKIAVDTFSLFENDKETYFRKDSLYHDFLKIYAKDMMLEELGIELDIRNYVNTDKLFSFFHRIYKSHDGESCRIIFDGMKDYVMRAVPEHQRTPAFTELCNIFFDQLYQEIFDLLKNIWSLIDPMEVDERYLGYLSQYYDMFDVTVETATILHIREFIRDMVWMIKRKGTYTEFYILWRILTGTKNLLMVYERWHRKDVENFPEWPSTISPPCTGTWPNFPYYSDTNDTTTVPASSYQDFMYVYRPEYESPVISGGAGVGWYQKRYTDVYNSEYVSPQEVFCPSGGFMQTTLAPSGDNLMLSTMYILETDISSEPLTKNEILTKEIWDTMMDYWEYIRPVNRVSDYRIVEAPITDMSGKYIHLYQVSSKSSAFLKTVLEVTFDIMEGGYVHQQPEDDPRIKWQINHNLGSDILIQVFDANMDEMVPKGIEYTPSQAILEFETPEAGYAIIKQADWERTKPSPVLSNTWRFYHLRLQKEVIIHYKLDGERMYIDDTHLLDEDGKYAEATFADRNNNSTVLGTGDFVYIQSEDSTRWEISHDQGMKGNIMSVYSLMPGEENRRMHPKEYTLIDTDNIVIEFEEAVHGYVVLVNVGDLSIDDLLDELESLIESVSWIAYKHDEYGNSIEIDSNDNVVVYRDDNYYYFDFKLAKEKTYTINEFELFDKNGFDENRTNLLFHSLMSDLYKPPGIDMTMHYRLAIPSSN